MGIRLTKGIAVDDKYNVHFNVTNTALAALRCHVYDDMTDEQKQAYWNMWEAWRNFEVAMFPQIKDSTTGNYGSILPPPRTGG
jgi:hypothetical protein